ncbi:MAG: RagB/SusD family nutrient uptake outer membrane protein [Bacteroidales bacterium]|nr:RagB/SusD family nutrient uptake outer membrane protein [Bacteroidales bacterium]MCM1146300.1 RagB/SusD family nutrient uptake outer membrane protein [Bacteroidales bacterium]MCM1205262.1 RagB/SusD family nutrient uptake outer membrane protein [Bacillota bacterium]MCM1509653.1 RagB/SusD family nutrient uptake outer membrane protein [Clostridium sp.]
MKTLYINKVLGVLFLSAAMSGMTACNDKLDELPDNRTDIDSPQKVGLLLTSGYPEASAAEICELYGDNFVDNNVCVPGSHKDANAKFQEEAYKWGDIKNYSTGEDDTPYQVWEAYYKGIAVCNHAIEAMETMSENPAGDPALSGFWGEAHVLRAYLHFVLVNVFAESYQGDAANEANRGIPYVTKPETVVNVDYSDNEYLHNIKETYALIEKDILEGINLIDDSKYTVPAYHFNKRAANAFAARFYLYKRDYRKALDHADAALQLSSLRNWAGLNTNTIETCLRGYNDETLTCNYLIQATYSTQDRMLSACRYAINDGNDAWGIESTKDVIYGGGPCWSNRLPAFNGKLYRWASGSEYGTWLFRVYEYFEYSDKIAGIGFVHMLYQPLTADETMLVRAEAKLYLDDQAGAISDLGQWTASHSAPNDLTLSRIKNFYAGKNAAKYAGDINPDKMGFEKILSGDDLDVLSCILHLRRIETHYEGLRWFDIKRYGINIKHVYRNALELNATSDELRYDDPRRVFQIPTNVINAGYPATNRQPMLNDANDKSIQNPVRVVE